MELLIVSGLSGAGKSVAMNALEDIGYFCIDNIPAALLPSITAFSKAGDNQLERVALCMDVRGCRTREEIEQARRKGAIIINAQDGAGYYQSEDIKDIAKQYRQNERRALSILAQQKHLRKRLKAAGVLDGKKVLI